MEYRWLVMACIPLVTASHHDIIQIHAIFRHGERTPADTYPNDPHKGHEFSPYGWGQLTNNGKKQQYEQGKYLRKRYGEFLGDKLSTNQVDAVATGVDRTRMSLMLMMAGLYPPEGQQIWNEELLWQPVPYSSQELNQDSLLLVRNCPRYQEALDYLLANDDGVKNELEKQKDLYTYLEEHCGRKVTNPDDVQDIYSTLKAEEDFGLQLPQWTQSVYPQRMANITAFSFQLNAYNKELQRIKAGPMLNKIIKESEKKAAGKSKKKFLAYAGHDSTVSNLEVHDHDGQPGIKVLLRNSTDHEPYELTIPGCQDVCPIDRMKTILAEVLPSESKDSMCVAKDPTYKPPADGGP